MAQLRPHFSRKQLAIYVLKFILGHGLCCSSAYSPGLCLRTGPREETSPHTEHCASLPGPSLSGRRTTAGNQNTGPCVKMIQNSGCQEQAVQAECGVPCDHAAASFPGRGVQRTTNIWGSSRVQEGGDATGCSVAHPPCRGPRRRNPSWEGEHAVTMP